MNERSRPLSQPLPLQCSVAVIRTGLEIILILFFFNIYIFLLFYFISMYILLECMFVYQVSSVLVMSSTQEASLGNLVRPISEVKGEDIERDSSLLKDRSLG